MKYLIIGAGAIGTYIGGSLLRSGQNVIFLEREELIQKLLIDGIKINLEDGPYQTSSVQVYFDFGQAVKNQPDVVIFAMKSFDTSSAAEMISKYKDMFKVVLCLQNGIENEQNIATYISEERVIGGSVTSAVERVDSGNATLEKKRGIGIANTHPLSRSIVNDFNNAGLNAKLYPKLMDLKWTKMLSNLLGNATSAILNMTPSEIFQNPETYNIECLEMSEAINVMRKMGFHPVNLPGVPMKVLLWTMLKLPQAVSRPILGKLLGSGRGGKMPSFHIDLHSGRQVLESTYLNGAISRLGLKMNIRTPINDVLNQKLQEMAMDNAMIIKYDHRVDLLSKDIQEYSRG